MTACPAGTIHSLRRWRRREDPVRDAAQLAMLGRLRALLPPGAGWRTEVPIPLPGDLRSWDAMVAFAEDRVAVEAESAVRDVQALDRKIALKQRDGGIDRLILLINDTGANRAAVRAHREDLRGRFPADGRELLKSIRASTAPARSGILLI